MKNTQVKLHDIKMKCGKSGMEIKMQKEKGPMWNAYYTFSYFMFFLMVDAKLLIAFRFHGIVKRVVQQLYF